MKIVILIFLFCLPVAFSKERFPTPALPELEIQDGLLKVGADTDDPSTYQDESTNHQVSISGFHWITPNLPSEIERLKSNNNVSITIFEHRLYLAFRTSSTHFAGRKTQLIVLSSIDGKNWFKELSLAMGTDLREPNLMVLNGELNFIYFKGGTNPFEFKPTVAQRLIRKKDGSWSSPQNFLSVGEVPWETKFRFGETYLTSYKGSHYDLRGESRVEVLFQKFASAGSFGPVVENSSPVIYRGGVSEVGWEFDEDGNLWAVTRNEDGDDLGFGSQVMFAPKNNLTAWRQIGQTDRNIYMSPKMFRVGSELYLVARKQLGRNFFDQVPHHYPIALRRIGNWAGYSFTAKGTALYKVNKASGEVVHVLDLPGTGDTAFPAIHRLNSHEVLIANYTSRLDRPRRVWLTGQLAHTEIYLLKLTFSSGSVP